METTCDQCGAQVLDIDVRCPGCGAALTSTGAHRMVGTVVLDTYEILDVLGHGGMSLVYEARHKLTHQDVALKILPPELAAHSQVKSRFLEEARALAQLDHPNIVHLYNFGEENGCFILAMQYVHGKTFERMILEAGRLDWPVAAQVCIDVLRALEYAHGRGVVHRDMKPSNILVREEDGSATVMDFGIAKMTGSTRLTATGQTMGTVRYMSPEQVRGQQVDLRSDIYSLGASLYEALVGDTPFDGETHFEIMTKHLSELPGPPSARGVPIPAALEQALMRALAKKPEGRFQSARELRGVLKAVLADADIGHAETMRMSRELVGPVVRAPRTTAPMAGSEPLPTSRDQAEASVAGPTDEPEPTDTVHRGPRRAPLLIALAASVVVASVGVAVVLARSNGDPETGERAATVTRADAATRDEPPAWPPALRPAGVQFAVERSYPDERIRVLSVSELDPDRVRDAHVAGRRRFAEILEQRGLADEVPPQPISILVVPRQVLCDPAVWDAAKDCGDYETHYRPAERTLLVDHDAHRLAVNVASGAAIAVCLHTDIPDCDRAVPAFYDELEREGPPEQ